MMMDGVTAEKEGSLQKAHLLQSLEGRKGRTKSKPEGVNGLSELKKLMNECLTTRGTGDSSSEPIRLNGYKTSADLLIVKFPTFASDPMKRIGRDSSSENTEEKREDKTRLSSIRRTKYSSTSTLFLEGTITKPDLFEMLQCISKALSYHINKGVATCHKAYYDIFNENFYPLMIGWDTVVTPNDSHIYEFMRIIFQYYKMDVECSIMSLIYVERMLEITNMTIDATNWRRIILAAIIVASKVWQDYAVWTQDFLQVFNNYITVQDLNNLELKFLGLIHYRLAISASTYAKYYYELRTYSHNEAKLPPKPLDKITAKRLEQRSTDTERTRSMSLSSAEPPHITHQVVIN